MFQHKEIGTADQPDYESKVYLNNMQEWLMIKLSYTGRGATAPLHQTEALSDIQGKLSLKLHHTRILESIPSYAPKMYYTVVQMWEENMMYLQST